MADQDPGLPTRFRPLGVYTHSLAEGPNSRNRTVGAQSLTLDGTQQKLRDQRLGSPFTFRVVPPDVLLNALTNGGESRPESPFDPKLRRVFQDALANLEQVQAQFDQGLATQEDLQAAQQGLLGGRSPAQGQNIGIMDAALRATNNFDAVLNRRAAFRKTSFYATGEDRPGLRNAQTFVTRNGAQVNSETAAQDPNSNQTAVADVTQALDVILQLNRIIDSPSLTLMVNPEQLSINYAKKQQYQDRNRFNYIFQSWGEEQVRLSVTGKSAGFVVGTNLGGVGEVDFDPTTGDFRVNNGGFVSGYQWASKLDSAGWQNLMALFEFYRNNGYIYDTAGRPRSEAHLFIGNIQISYDQWVYIGNFENFRYSYSEQKQHGAIEFSFDFVASFIFDRSRGGITPVRPYQSPPTPSPSQAQGGESPVLSNPASQASRGLMNDTADGSTAILDLNVSPRAFSGMTAVPFNRTVNPFGEG